MVQADNSVHVVESKIQVDPVWFNNAKQVALSVPPVAEQVFVDKEQVVADATYVHV